MNSTNNVASNQQLEPCTWKDCDQIARHPRSDSYGRVWSNVCDTHDALMKKAAIDAFESKGQRGTEKLVAMWIKAQGGAEKAADRAIGRRTHE